MGRDIFRGMRHIPVAMPTADAYKKTVNRDDIVQRFGESTVTRAELAAIMNIMIATGMVRSQELVDVVIRQCEFIETQRRQEANLDADNG
jgi:hypothetical protein